MNLDYDDNPCPRIAGGFKLAVAAVLIGLVVLVGQSPIDWSPMTTTVHDVAAAGAPPTETPYFPSAFTLEATDAAPHVEAF